MPAATGSLVTAASRCCRRRCCCFAFVLLLEHLLFVYALQLSVAQRGRRTAAAASCRHMFESLDKVETRPNSPGKNGPTKKKKDKRNEN